MKSKGLGCVVWLVLLVIGGTCVDNLYAQSKYRLRDNITLKGYVKYLQTNFIQSTDSLVTDNLFHNRLNFRIFLPGDFTGGVELRNRVFFGEVVKGTPGYGDLVTDYDGVLKLEKAWINTNALVFNTIVDRLWLDYGSTRFEARIGRQRINWGINPVWNPNDLFNAFDYLDFDYEERPGSDAVRVEYYVGDMSSLEGAYKWAKDSEDNVGALKYKFNTRTYDIQVLAGRFRKDWALGAGWAGNIKDAGFKGEGTVFIPSEEALDQDVTVSLTATLEYGFRNGWVGMASYLLNSSGLSVPVDFNAFLLFEADAKTLMPNRHTAFVSFFRQFSPVLGLNLGGFYAFEVNWLIFFPTLTYSIEENWDVDLVGQLFWGEDIKEGFINQGNGLFFRIKWSF